MKKPQQLIQRGLLLTLLSLGTSLQAAPLSALGEIVLTSIEDGQARRLDSQNQTAQLISFFEPDCPWCARQLRDLDAARHQCATPLPFALVGIHGDRMELRLTLRRAQAEHLPAYVASPELLETLQGIPATPHAVILDAQGHPIARMRGYIPLAQLCEIAELLARARTETAH